MLETKVCEIEGGCPVYEVGDRIVIDEPKILLDRMSALFVHALSILFHCVAVLKHDWRLVTLGLITPEDSEHACMQCVDAGEPCIEGETVVFGCRGIEGEFDK